MVTQQYKIDLHFHYLGYCAYEIIKKYEKILHDHHDVMKTKKQGEGVISVNPILTGELTEIIKAAGNISKLLAKPTRKNRFETESEYSFRKYRQKHLMEFIGDIDIAPLINRNARDTLEHFDERLDKFAIQLSNMRQNNIRYCGILDIHFSHMQILNDYIIKMVPPGGKAFLMRTYVFETHLFTVFGDVVNVCEIYQIAKNILKLYQNIETGIFTPDGTPAGIIFN